MADTLRELTATEARELSLSSNSFRNTVYREIQGHAVHNMSKTCIWVLDTIPAVYESLATELQEKGYTIAYIYDEETSQIKEQMVISW